MRRILGMTVLAVLTACGSHKAEVKADEAVTAPAAEAAQPAAAPAAQPAPAPTPAAASAPKIVIAAPATEAAAAPVITAAPAPAAAPLVSTTVAQAPARTPAKISKAAAAIVHAKDRTAEDHALDEGRKPAEMLTFFDLKPGMKVAEIGAGGGYTTELLARAVGPTGTVYAQNPSAFLSGFLKEVWPARLARPVNAKVVRVDREFAAPLPDDAKDLDAIVIVAIYHDTVAMEVDRQGMNEVLFKALKPGGALYVIDSSARMDSGIADAKTLHRIDEAIVLEEAEEAGFRFESESDFLRNPLDMRDWNSSPASAGERRGSSDRFALKFLKPRHHHRADKAEGGEKPADAASDAKSAATAKAPAAAKADAKSAAPAKANAPAAPKAAARPAPKKDADADGDE